MALLRCILYMRCCEAQKSDDALVLICTLCTLCSGAKYIQRAFALLSVQCLAECR